MNKEGPGTMRRGFVAHCPHCRQQSLFVHARISHGRHLLLTLVTGGLWAFLWIGLCISKALRPWRCESCGWHKPEFRTTLRTQVAGVPGLSPKKMQPPTVE